MSVPVDVSAAADEHPLGNLTALPSADATAGDTDPLGFPGYADKLAAARVRSGADESLDVGCTEVAGLDVVAAVGRFAFLGGSMGAVHGARVAGAMAHAAARHLPFVAVTRSGGARVQEGMVALTQLARGAEGIRVLRRAGVPSIAWMRHPTTGGVYASYAGAADVVIADAGATIGFAGPRVVEATIGVTIDPAHSHTAEAAATHGLVDEVAHTDALTRIGAWVGLLHPASRAGALPAARPPAEPETHLDALDAVRRARADDRPGARTLLAGVFDTARELRGDRAGGLDEVALAAVARLGGRSVVVLGLDRDATAAGVGRGRAGAAGYRTLRRGVALAARHGLPVITLVDTPGADPGPASDRDGLAQAIAELFIGLLDAPVPTIGVVTGEGGSGGASALTAADRVLQQDDAVFEVIAPEGAATILHRDPDRGDEVAPLLRPTAHELRALRIVDRVLPGPTTHGATTAAAALRAALAVTLADLDEDPRRAQRRRHRYGAGQHG